MTKDEALKLALSTLDEVRQETFRLLRDGQKLYAEDKVWSTIISIKEVLAQEQEPVAWMHPDGRLWTFGKGFDKSTFTIPLYTTPPQRKPEQEPVAWEQFYPDIGKPQIAEALAKEKALQDLHDENERLGLYKDAYAEQEPMAWISTGPARMIHWTSDKPAYGDDWVPLYTAPPPCPTCEALARTVMMDQRTQGDKNDA